MNQGFSQAVLHVGAEYSAPSKSPKIIDIYVRNYEK